MNGMRKLLAVIVVGTWSVSIAMILLLMIFGLIDVAKGEDVLKTFSSVSSGFVGMVFGYYFTRGHGEP